MQLWTKGLGLAALCVVAVAIANAQQPPPAAQPGKSGTAAQPGTPGQPGGPANAQNTPRFDAARFLKDHDKNGDGKLSKDELPAVAQKEFEHIDANKDGFITQDELQQHADRMARQRPQLVEVVFYSIDFSDEPVSVQELQTAYDQLRKLDKNNDGKIDESELKVFREQRKKERIDSIFTALDRNGDGKISKDEARGLWADNFTQLDKNGDGFLDRQEVEAAASHRTGQPGSTGQPGNTGSNPVPPKRP